MIGDAIAVRRLLPELALRHAASSDCVDEPETRCVLDSERQEIEIAGRFCGPSDSGNGGYCAGLLATALTSSAAEVTLKLPPPLGRPLTIRRAGGVAHLLDGDLEIAEAREAELALDVPAAPGFAEAQVASRRYTGFKHHLFPGCFVCGPGRGPDDGLRIFAGPLADRPLAVAPWVPGPDLGDGQGRVAAEFVWAALDCPGYFGLLQPGLVALLGRMHGEILEPPRAGERCVVSGWRIGEDGRKFFAGSAIHGEDGRLLARAKAIWIQIDRARFQVSAAG